MGDEAVAEEEMGVDEREEEEERETERSEVQRVFWRLRDIELEMRECRRERELQERKRKMLQRSKNQLMRGMTYRRSMGRGRGEERRGNVDGSTNNTTV